MAPFGTFISKAVDYKKKKHFQRSTKIVKAVEIGNSLTKKKLKKVTICHLY